MNFFNRLQGVFFSPQTTFKALAEKPVWKLTLVFILILTAVFIYLVNPYIQQDTLKTFKNNVKLQERLGEERYNRMLERYENPTKTSRLLGAFVFTPITMMIGLLLSSLFLLVIGRLTSTEGKFILVFSAFIHANIIDKLLGNAVRLILIFTRKSFIQTTTSLALFFPRLEVLSTPYIILSQFDFFQLWMFGILAYGLAAIFKISLKKALFVSYGFFILKSAFNIALALIQTTALR
ncbi:MAG: YIP1 family protein [Candidatus Aminicenantes bacterium]|nr:YIP1 family protein [Candidatus Aminicenantes bacterium]